MLNPFSTISFNLSPKTFLFLYGHKGKQEHLYSVIYNLFGRTTRIFHDFYQTIQIFLTKFLYSFKCFSVLYLYHRKLFRHFMPAGTATLRSVPFLGVIRSFDHH